MTWISTYRNLSAKLPSHAAAAGSVACLSSSCIDIVVRLSDLTGIKPESQQATELLHILEDRAEKGIGGEVVLDWPEGGRWVRENMPHRLSWGGTGPHVTMALTELGVQSLTALADRSEMMLSTLPHSVPLATPDGIRTAHDVRRSSAKRHEVCVYEYTAGQKALGHIVPRRSSRIIVRLGDLGLEEDPEFDRITTSPDFGIGAGLICGIQCIPRQELSDAYRRAASLAKSWSDNGAAIIHLELAGFTSVRLVHDALDALSGHITSVGMSESEFREYFDTELASDDLLAAMRKAARHYGLRRLCVHADHWMATITQGDPSTERDALMLGAMLAATRAETGHAGIPDGIPDGAQIHEPPFEPDPAGYGEYQAVVVPTLYLPSPRTTLGMGDTFTAGCLLAFSATSRPGKQAKAGPAG